MPVVLYLDLFTSEALLTLNLCLCIHGHHNHLLLQLPHVQVLPYLINTDSCTSAMVPEVSFNLFAFEITLHNLHIRRDDIV